MCKDGDDHEIMVGMKSRPDYRMTRAPGTVTAGDSEGDENEMTMTMTMAITTTPLVMFWPGLAQKPRLWLGLRRLWLSQELGRAKAATHGLAQAAAFGTHSCQICVSHSGSSRGRCGIAETDRALRYPPSERVLHQYDKSNSRQKDDPNSRRRRG